MQAMERLQEHLFLSTLSLRRATVYTCPIISTIIHFYPRSPCGERPGRMTENGTKKLTFLSTLSLRRATNSGAAAPAPGAISIHALLAESDQKSVEIGG